MLRIDCVRMLAVAKSGHLDSLAVGGRHRRGALLPRPAPRPRAPRLARARPLRALQGPRGADPVRGARPARLLPARGPDGAAQDRRPAPGPPRHEPHRRASRSRPARSARGSRCASGSRSRCASTGSTTPRTSSACSPTATARRARPGRRRPPRPTSGVSNLTAIVDYNHLQTDGTTEEVMDIGDVRAKFEAFGWDAVEIDGHDMAAVVEALERSRTLDRPAAIVCQTKKGKGVSAMEGRFGFHGKPPEPGAGRRGARGARGAARAADQGRCTRPATRASSDERRRRAEDRADRDPPRPTATRWSSSASEHEESSRSTPTSPSRRSRSSSASASRSGSSTSARRRRT